MNQVAQKRVAPKRVALVGCGSIGALHAKHLAGRAELVFCSRTRANAEHFNSQFGGLGVFDRYEDLLQDERVDAILLATPAALHKDQIIAALSAGKATLVEKPICISAGELDEITTAARQGGGNPTLMIAENYYYKPSLASMRQMIQSGDIGQVRSIEVRKLTRQQPGGWRQPLGSLLEGGVHFLALIGDLADVSLGKVVPGESEVVHSPLSLLARFPTRTAPEPERHAHVELLYGEDEEDLSASLHYAWDVPSATKGTFQHSRINGDAGRITFESNGIYIWLSGRRRRLKLSSLGDLLGYKAMMEDFLHCLECGNSPYSNLERARRDMGIVFKAYAG